MPSFAWPATSQGNDAALYARVVLDAIAADQCEYSFVPLQAEWNGHTATFKVLAKPIKVDGFYPGAGARLAQQVADLMGCMFMTARLADLAFAQRGVTLLPIGLGNTPQQLQEMQYVSTMRAYAAKLDAAATAAGYSGGILSTVGKPWIVDNLLAATPTKAENYGWSVVLPGGIWAGSLAHSATDPKVGVVQGYWWPPAHTAAQNDTYAGDQADYSEVLSGLVHRTCVVDGAQRDIVDVAADPDLCGLITVDRKPLKVFRQPNVPVYACVSSTAAQTAAAIAGGMCPLPPLPDHYVVGGSGGGWLPWAFGGLAVAAAGWATRGWWLPPLKRVVRRFA